MYSVTVRRGIIAQHFLTVPNPGPEGKLHSHEFGIEVTFEGPDLGEYGYLVNIDAVKSALDTIEQRYADATLNDLPEFEDRNPSVEHFSRIIASTILDSAAPDNPDHLRVRIWEDDEAAASYETAI